MREDQFRTYLSRIDEITSKEKAINSRVSRGYAVEEIVGESLDSIVSNDDEMYKALLKVKTSPKERSGNLQNALRWYYEFVNGKKFPRVLSYERSKR